MTTEKFEIFKIVLDKGILAVMLGLFGFYLNRSLESYKSSMSRESELLKQNESLKNDLYKQALNYRIQRIEKQLSEFYWPIYSALQKDNAIWERISGVSPDGNTFPKNISRNIETRIILENHKRVVQIFEDKMYLSDASKELLESINQYIRHVALYVSLRENNVTDQNPIDFGEEYPSELYNMIKNETNQLQDSLRQLIQEMNSR